ncbi:DnaJ domain-containing protein [Nocardioides sp. TRM66260-LWL]|uniref:DnaJ domain-containing protein n=1 Tax=Nocardioides sp. TRM66260-LWL TaxID=2874478 RepID=UPI001CC3FF8B|nr:DnaJ domain-containing protein [Nocardioides sp. TRM66260-LWL]MBZ5735227.1 DnaJ domain-containing protein [Nocardioides sp. TRM66260-LWL]
MTPSWYDVLGVEPDATPEEIRTAWQAQIGALGPTDRRFRTLNQAAEVLLDPDQRAAHDAELAGETAPKSTSEPTPVPLEKEPPAVARPAGSAAAVDDPAPTESASAPRPVRTVPTWALLVAGVAATALLVVTIVVGVLQVRAPVDDAGAAEAEGVAARALGPVLSYDYRSLDQDASAARSYMTQRYARDDYDRLFTVIQQNAPGLKAVVQAKVVSTGVTRTGRDRVQVLAFVDQLTTNAKRTAPTVFRNQVTVTMVREDGSWLLDDLSVS